MESRISSSLLFVGSLPTTSSEESLRCCGDMFGDVVFALPDGETGPRKPWIGFEAARMLGPHPDFEPTQDVLNPAWLYAAGGFRLRPGVEEITFDLMPRIDEAIESYGVFCSLREEGVIPEGVRFQVSLPFPASVGGWFFLGPESLAQPRIEEGADFAHDYPIFARAYEDVWSRELPRLLEAIPAEDLAIQWDVCWEVLDQERLFQYSDEAGAWERFAGPVRRMSKDIPEDVLVGYHLCYGTFPEWPMREAQDMKNIVDMANYCAAESGRQVDFLHIAGSRSLRSNDDSFYRPLENLKPAGARVFLGLILPVDGALGTEMRVNTARKYLDDFGIAMYCGFGRQPGEDAKETLAAHRAAYDKFVTAS